MYKDYIAYISSLFIFGMNGIIASFINLTSYEIVLFRTMIGSVTMLIIFLLTGHRFTFGTRRRDMVYQILSGIFNAGTWLFLYEGYQQIGVGITTLLSYCGPVIVKIGRAHV